MDITELERAVKYATNSTSDFFRSVSDPHELTPHLMLADWLMEGEDPDLGQRIKREVERNQKGERLKPVKLGDNQSTHDFILHAVRTGHPNPTVRALAGRFGDLPHPHLFDVLFHSDPTTRPTDHDVAVWLSPEDHPSTHATHAILKRINSRANFEGDLEAKVVRGTAYLLDHRHPDRNGYGAPGIVFEAPVNDRSEMEALAAHAAQLASERNAGELGPARMGPVTYGLDRVLKYGLAPIGDIQGMLAACRAGGPFDGNNHADGVLADYLQDHDDPRHQIVRRDLSYRNPDYWAGATNHRQELLGTDESHIVRQQEHQLEDGTTLAIRTFANLNTAAIAHGLNWVPSRNGEYLNYHALFTPEEYGHIMQGLGLDPEG